MDEKKHLYFEQGAKEFWICKNNGVMVFFDTEGVLEKSIMVSEFPKKITL